MTETTGGTVNQAMAIPIQIPATKIKILKDGLIVNATLNFKSIVRPVRAGRNIVKFDLFLTICPSNKFDGNAIRNLRLIQV